MKVVTVVGARPQIVKAAAITRALGETDIDEVLIDTGQHYDADMSRIFFDELAVPAPTYSLRISGGGHGVMTGRMLEALEPVLMQEAPGAVVVFGDTNSTIAGALAAAKLHLPVVHVEAGLRSFNRSMPEEINRVVTDHLSTLLLAPTWTAVTNLATEGISEGVHHVGDVMYDVMLHALARAEVHSTVLQRFGLSDRQYAVATVHRAENTDDAERLAEILEYLRQAAADKPIVIPLHPRTRLAVEREGLSLEGLVVSPPLPYLDMVRLVSSACEVYTDSGGLQKEAYFHRVPCVTLREETEWVETVAAGWNRLWHEPKYGSRREIADYGDGTSAARCVELIARLLSNGSVV